MSALAWTTDKPTAEGWYWWRSCPEEKARIVQVYDAGEPYGLHAVTGAISVMIPKMPGQWSGPIPKPE